MITIAKEYKQIAFKLHQKDDAEDQGIFSGLAAVFGNVDSGGDVIEPGAFSAALEKGLSRVKILYGHDETLPPIGRPLELKETDEGLYIKGMISDTSLGRDARTLLSDGVLTEMSIGYEPLVYQFDEDGIRHLQEVDLWEVSIVPWAMNDKALITNYKKRPEEAERPPDGEKRLTKGQLQHLRSLHDSLKSASGSLDAFFAALERKERIDRIRARKQAAQASTGRKPEK